MDKKFVSGLAMLALAIVAIGTLANYILAKLGANVPIIVTVVAIVTHIITVLAYLFVAIYAYQWVKSTPSRKRLTYQVLYACCIVIIIVFYVLNYLP